jgi:DNA-binding MarR family transcriptional regulator
MLSQLGQANSREFAELMATAGLEPRHFAVLSHLSRAPGESQQAVAQALNIPVSTMVSLLDAMEAHGWLVRRVHRTDRRARTLHLTAKGSATLRRLTTAAWAHEEKTCAGLTEEERARLLELLARLAPNLGVHPLELPDRGLGPGAIGVEPSTSAPSRREARERPDRA